MPRSVIQSVDKDLWLNKNIISAIKGILPDTKKLLNDYLVDCMGFPLENYMSVMGPCHAEEVAEERLSYLTFSGLNDDLTCGVAKLFANHT